jgi:hypothetical protein
LCGNVVEAGVSARSRERLLGHFQNALAVPLRICARLSSCSWVRFPRGGMCTFLGHG